MPYPTAFTPPALLWFRNDQHLANHAALQAAMRGGRPILPVFVLAVSVLDEAAACAWAPSNAHRRRLHHGLASRGAALTRRGTPLVLRRGPAAQAMPGLAKAVRASEVHIGRSALPRARQPDRQAAEARARALTTIASLREVHA